MPAGVPHLWAAWRQGKVTERGATHAARETACLEVENRLEVDRFLAADPDTLVTIHEVDAPPLHLDYDVLAT
ncbi:hypothetical protein [Nocardioides deserti]|uniref:Uncharacterized protein n=1 Tax=Nocardioides deserti TaxID=1588644 RepID=A0ABR6UAR3_9ACTN|nr:hypothetical protein [Nocardioides deserti]MBC2961534.1 hypothetical protein [Nocardioides deserti]GGO78241.1 hypothetical protein GCM10012276_35180 [Nocardioides deserti]